MSYAVIGTAGHIDHGKTTLVQALTGTWTDSLPDERRRGMTLDLGFTWFDFDGHRMAVIDVPGHEKYIARMLCGVAAIDIGLLVVAADEGVALQTIEHLSILASLHVPRLVVALSKSDLSDDVTMTIIEDDVRELCLDRGYVDFDMHRVSAATGQGIPALKQTLAKRAADVSRKGDGGILRLPVDRCLTVEGRGCVVAGTIWTGQVRQGDSVQILPSGKTARVRNIEVHGESVDTATAGYRTALNLAGIARTDVARGFEIVTPDSLRPVQRCVAEVSLYQDAPDIPNGRFVRLHAAAGSVTAGILTGGSPLSAGMKSVVVLTAKDPVVLTPGQLFLLRRPGACGTFAGGRVLAAHGIGAHRTGKLIAFGKRLQNGPPAERLLAWLDLRGPLDLSDPATARDLGLSDSECRKAAAEAASRGHLENVPDSTWIISTTVRDRLAETLLQRLERRQRDGKPVWVESASLLEETRPLAPDAVRRWVLDRLIRSGRVIRLGDQVLSAAALNLTKSRQELLSRLLNHFRECRRPPNAAALPNLEQKPQQEIDTLLKLAVSRNMLIRLGDGWFLTPDVLEELKAELTECFSEKPARTVAEIRDHWGLTRKHAVPFLEYFDRIGWTSRDGDYRTAGPQLTSSSSGTPR